MKSKMLSTRKIQSVSASRRNGQRKNGNLHSRDEKRFGERKIRADARAGNRFDAGFFQKIARRFRRRSGDSAFESFVGERFDEWRRIRSGAARIVIGTRSAVFAPLENIGLIIVDEEHDGSYRQHESPFYHGRDVAIVRANFANAVVVLGSATPALESFHNSHIGKYEYLTLKNRVGNRPMAQAEIVDMREVFKARAKTRFFRRNSSKQSKKRTRGEQSIILLNRRGFSQFVLCRSCGETIRCNNCDITLTFHKREGKFVCHYCNHRERTPRKCPLAKASICILSAKEQNKSKIF
jgi:primosomal protein N' (replication factor Y)